MKIDIDDGQDPMRWDPVNWTASNAEIDGVQMNEEAARRAQVPGTPWFEVTEGEA